VYAYSDLSDFHQPSENTAANIGQLWARETKAIWTWRGLDRNGEAISVIALDKLFLMQLQFIKVSDLVAHCGHCGTLRTELFHH
jgi:hypothetical protein